MKYPDLTKAQAYQQISHEIGMWLE